MRKGKGKLTYLQLSNEYNRIKRELYKKDAALAKLQHELHAMTVAHNKLLKNTADRVR